MDRMILSLLGRSISKATLSLCGELIVLVLGCSLGSLSSVHHKSNQRGDLLRSHTPRAKRLGRGWVSGCLEKECKAEWLRARGTSGVRSLLWAAVLEDFPWFVFCWIRKRSWRAFSRQVARQALFYVSSGKFLVFLVKMKFSIWKFLFCGNGISD